MKTTITWFRNDVCRPARNGSYLTICNGDDIGTLPFSVKHQKWNAHDYEETPKYGFDVDFWGMADEFPRIEEE